MIAGPPHHLALRVRDLASMERWYRSALGLTVLRRWPDEGGRDRSVWLDLGGGAFLALEQAEGEARAGPPLGLFLLALRIPAERRADWERHLDALGTSIERRSRWTLYLRDPEGNRLGLSSHPDALELP